MNDILGGIFALMFIGALLAYLGPLLVDVLQWLLGLVGAY